MEALANWWEAERGQLLISLLVSLRFAIDRDMKGHASRWAATVARDLRNDSASGVYTLGNPEGFAFTFAEGIVSAVRPTSNFRTHFSDVHADIIQTTAPISQGSSGGGLFDEDGNLIGITQSGHATGENLNFAIAADVLWVRYGELIPMRPNPLLK